jgi:hypothetical protein
MTDIQGHTSRPINQIAVRLWKMDMNYEKIVALFDTAEHAEATSRNLQAAGFPVSEISIIDNKILSSEGVGVSEPGLWLRFFGRNIEQHEAVVYGRTVGTGGTVLTLRVPESDVPRAMGMSQCP